MRSRAVCHNGPVRSVVVGVIAALSIGALESTAQSEEREGVEWPADGVCVVGRDSSDGACLRLKLAEARALSEALQSYLGSKAALQKHAKKDLETAGGALGEPWLIDETQPLLGRYWLSRVGAKKIAARVTIAIGKQVRWGYAFEAERTGDEWRVSSFGRWKAWRKR